MGSVADCKTKVIQLYMMEMSINKISDSVKKKPHYIHKVIDEFEKDGTITVNSKINIQNYRDAKTEIKR